MRRFFRLLNLWRHVQLTRSSRNPSARQRSLYTDNLRRMSWVTRHELVLSWLDSDDPNARVMENYARQWADPDGAAVWGVDHTVGPGFKGAQVLLTWQGPFGEFDKERLVGPEWPSTDELVTVLRSGHHCDAIERQLKVCLEHWTQKFDVKYWAYSIELCAGTWEDARAQHCSAELKAEDPTELPNNRCVPIRIHVHLSLRFNGHKHRPWAAFDFAGCSCFVGESQSERQGRNFQTMDLSGNGLFFYVQVEKKGWIAGQANYHPWKDFLVHHKWILNLWQQNKITYLVARGLIVQVSFGEMGGRGGRSTG